jgi:hypothetical protein
MAETCQCSKYLNPDLKVFSVYTAETLLYQKVTFVNPENLTQFR